MYVAKARPSKYETADEEVKDDDDDDDDDTP
jgi:hypothetical protein